MVCNEAYSVILILRIFLIWSIYNFNGYLHGTMFEIILEIVTPTSVSLTRRMERRDTTMRVQRTNELMKFWEIHHG